MPNLWIVNDGFVLKDADFIIQFASRKEDRVRSDAIRSIGCDQLRNVMYAILE
jgi:hypothetical protein